VPLGSLRLKLVDLVYQLLKLKNNLLLSALVETKFFSHLSDLLELYPWNNFLQLKAIAIFDEVLDSEYKELAARALRGSRIGETLIRLAGKSHHEHKSGRTIRNGYMAVIVKIANSIVKAKDKDFVKEYLESLGEEWHQFEEGELKTSNDSNTKSLGGQQPRPSGSDDDDMDSSTSMESILSRFSNFNTAMTQKANSINDNDDDDEDEDEEEENEDDRDSIMKERD
jgi:SIT4 phosphatase-associated protein